MIASTRNLMVNDHCQIIGIIYVCKTNTPEITLSEEHDKFIWIQPEEYKEYNLHDSFVKEMDIWNRNEIIKNLQK